MTKKKRNVPRPRNLGTMTEAAYWQKVRQALRSAFRYYLPIKAAKEAARVKYTGPGRFKFAYLCAGCNLYYTEKEIQVDHITPAGSLKGPEDLAPFLERLTIEDPAQYQVLCKACHFVKSAAEKKSRAKI